MLCPLFTQCPIFRLSILFISCVTLQLKKSFYAQQDELTKLRELLKGKELKIRQLEYENKSLKKKTGGATTDDQTTDTTTTTTTNQVEIIVTGGAGDE